MCVFLGSEGRSNSMLFVSSGRINSSALVVTVEDSAANAAAAERAASAAAETPPFNFSTSRHTCIFRTRSTALVSEYPFALIAAGIFTVVAGLPEHATKTLCPFLPEDISHTFGGPKVLLTGNSIRGKRILPRKDPIDRASMDLGVKNAQGMCRPIKQDPTIPQCNIGCRKSSCEFLKVKINDYLRDFTAMLCEIQFKHTKHCRVRLGFGQENKMDA